MGKLKKIDLNEFELIRSEDELGESNGYRIFPVKYADGTQPPPMLWKRKENNYVTIEDVDNVVWIKELRVSTKGSDTEYAKRVDWWIENALADDEWKTNINNTYNKHGFRIKESMDKAVAWLKTRTPSARKSHLHKFFQNWFLRGLHKAMYSNQNRGN